MMHFTSAAPKVSAPSISQSAMLSELSISVWTARKKDRTATNDLLRQNNADSSAGAFSKNLLAGCAELDAIAKFAANARTLHASMTMPWSDTGPRLLSGPQYFKHTEAMTAMKAEFDRLVDAFITAYDWQVAQVHAKLGNLFSRDEYPDVEKVRSKFGFRVTYMPVPEAGDWRVDISNEGQRELQQQYARFYEQRTQQAVQSVVGRLYNHLERLVRQLEVDADGNANRVFDSTIDNVRTFAEMLEGANFTNDPVLTEAHTSLQSLLAGVTKDDLVKNPGFRADTRRALDAALKALPSLGWDDEG